MTFERFNELMLLFGPVLPLLGLPLYLLFALAGKWKSRTAVYLSLSAPGLLIPVYHILDYEHAGRHLYSVFDEVILVVLIDPGAALFPAVFIVQLVNVFRGKWKEMTKSSVIFIVLLLFFYFWNFFVLALMNDQP
jgi:hypothetical protein